MGTSAAAASLCSLLNGSSDETSPLNYCNCCNARLNPAKLVFNVRTGVVTVPCDDCGEVNTVGNLDRKDPPPPIVQPLMEVSNKSALTEFTETINLTKDIEKEDFEDTVCDPSDGEFSREKRRFFVRIFGFDQDRTACEKTFKCQWCDYSSKLKHQVKRHERVHTLEKPYSCQYCGKKFARKENLTVHTRLHTGEKPFGCKICGESFLYKRQYNIHKENVHPVNTPQPS